MEMDLEKEQELPKEFNETPEFSLNETPEFSLNETPEFSFNETPNIKANEKPKLSLNKTLSIELNETPESLLNEIPSTELNETSGTESNELPESSLNETPSIESNETSGTESNELPESSLNETPSIESNETSGTELNETSGTQSNETSGTQSNETSGTESNEIPSIETNETPSIESNEIPNSIKNDLDEKKILEKIDVDLNELIIQILIEPKNNNDEAFQATLNTQVSDPNLNILHETDVDENYNPYLESDETLLIKKFMREVNNINSLKPKLINKSQVISSRTINNQNLLDESAHFRTVGYYGKETGLVYYVVRSFASWIKSWFYDFLSEST
jgi:hypothetical protein